MFAHCIPGDGIAGGSESDEDDRRTYLRARATRNWSLNEGVVDRFGGRAQLLSGPSHSAEKAGLALQPLGLRDRVFHFAVFRAEDRVVPFVVAGANVRQAALFHHIAGT